MHPLGRQKGKRIAEVESLLRAENRIRSRPGPIGFEFSMVEHKPKKPVILLHSRACIVATFLPVAANLVAHSNRCCNK